MRTPPDAPEPTAAAAAGPDPARLMEAAAGSSRSAGLDDWKPPSPESLLGVIPGYRIVRMLGHGGMGAVYEAVQESLDRTVAIKLLPPALEQDPEFAARFRREAKAMARLNHPNIVQIHDYGQASSGQHYFVMEFVDGCDLHQLVKSGQLDAEGALNAVSQVCDALQYAHEQGFVHRDIKPANVLMNHQGVLKVGDFGLAKLMEGGDAGRTEAMSLTMTGYAVGTPNYAAPEQLMGEGHVDHRADLYSLGVMFYEMLTREIPRGAPTPPSRAVRNLDVRIDGVVFKAMSPEPDARYQTAVELRHDVDTIRATPPPAPAAPSEPIRASRPRPTRRHARTEEDELLRSTRSLNNTMLVLGLVALATLGAVAFFLADRKTGDVIATETSHTQTEVTNSYFTQLVAFGVTTAQDLAEVSEFHAWQNGFVGVSNRPLTREAAEDLARRTGSTLLSMDADPVLTTWVSTTFPSHTTQGLWVTRQNATTAFRSDSASAAAGMLHRALLWWGGQEAPVVISPPPSEIGPTAPEMTPVPAPAAAPPRTHEWVNRAGVTIRAEFVSLDGDTVTLRKDGKSYAVPLEKLTPASTQLARQLQLAQP